MMLMMVASMLKLIICLCIWFLPITSFHTHFYSLRIRQRQYIQLSMKQQDNDINKYSNPVAAFLGNFLPNTSQQRSNANDTSDRIVDQINWSMPKRAKYKSSTKFITDLKNSLTQREWFVTGNVDPSFFDCEFRFQDPDVSITGIEAYGRGVNKLFNQKLSRAEIISVTMLTDNDTKGNKKRKTINNQVPAYSILVSWRLSGRVNIGSGDGLYIKPFIVNTELVVNDKSGLIIFQEDKFSIPGWDIFLSAFIPSLPFLQPPAPPLS